MDIIQLLPEHIANQIAAGEVIQRPSSAVKEMLENSIDAGSKNIELFIKDAGKTLIQVIDDGCGMSKKDAKISFQRHSTSKIRNANDLFAIQTMGFRGEAMAAMAAIAHIDICTKLTEKELGTEIKIVAGEIKSQRGCVCESGTSIKIKNLFFNVPARRNFLKSDKIETKHIIEQFHRIALGNPEISWSLSIDDKEHIHLERSNLRQRIVNIIGKRNNEKLVPIEEKTSLVNINGFIGKPEFAKKRRGEQYFFVNGRFIKSYYLNHAVNTAFKGLIAETYHPSYFIYLQIDPSQIDVNIHPTKTEIKFQDEKSIYSILRSAIKRSLGKYNIAPTLDFNIEPAFEIPKSKSIRIVSEPKIKVNTNYNPFETTINDDKTDVNRIYLESNKEDIQTAINNSDYNQTNFNLFQINNTYIIARFKEELIIIHQQRAHQRVLYERFEKKTSKNIDSQQLLFPQKINLSKKEMNEILEIKIELNNAGFEFTGDKESLEVTSVPSHCMEQDMQSLFEEILKDHEIEQTNLEKKFSSDISKCLSKTLSIKSGQKLSNPEMNILIEDLMNCQNKSVSPYGLATYFNVATDKEINKKFNK